MNEIELALGRGFVGDTREALYKLVWSESSRSLFHAGTSARADWRYCDRELRRLYAGCEDDPRDHYRWVPAPYVDNAQQH